MLLLGELRRMARRVIALTAAAQLLLWCAACGGFWPGSGTTSPHLLSLTVSPNPFQVALGSTGQAKATGTFSDGTERDLTSSVSWTVEGANIASISSTGVIRPNSTGAGFLRAVYETVSTKAPLTITAAPLVSLAINPSSPNLPLGLGVQLKAIGQYADSSTGDVTSQVNWSSGSTTIATVGPSGQAVSRSLGVTTISASMGNVQASAALSVTAAALTAIAVTGGSQSLAIGQKTQMHALGSFTDGSRQDLTASAQWTSSNPKVVAVNNAGLAVASSQGSATIAASMQSLSAASPLSVTSAARVSLSVTPSSGVILPGSAHQLLVTGTYTDGSTADLTANSTWNSSDLQTVSVDSHAMVYAFDVGNAQATASYQHQQASAGVTVQPTQAVSRFVLPPHGVDTTLRIVSPGAKRANVCA